MQRDALRLGRRSILIRPRGTLSLVFGTGHWRREPWLPYVFAWTEEAGGSRVFVNCHLTRQLSLVSPLLRECR